MKRKRKKKSYKKPIIITLSALLVTAAAIITVVIITTENITKNNIGSYVTLGQYSGIEYEPLDTEVTEEDVNARIDVRRGNVSETIEITDRAVENGDTVFINFEGFVDGEAFEGGFAENFDLVIGSGSFIPGFEEQIIGHKPGDEFEINVTFPEDYDSADLAGKPTMFKINLLSINAKVLPEFNDAFVQANSELNTIAEYRAMIREELKQQKEEGAESAKQESVWRQIIEGATAHKYPKKDLDMKIEQVIKDYEDTARSYGETREQLFRTVYGDDMSNEELEELFLKESRDVAERRSKEQLVVQAIAFLEGITVSNSEVDEVINNYRNYGYPSRADFLRAYNRESVRVIQLAPKVMEFVTGSAVAATPAPEVE